MNERSSSPQSIYLIFAIACGVLVANLYYAQPLLKPIGHDLSLPLSMTGLIVTMTQIGFVAGLLFLVPLFDRIENRRLILFVVTILIVALFLVGMSHNAFVFFLSSCLIGLGAVAAQIIVPFAAQLSNALERGRRVGMVMSGLLLGIMFARPIASIVTFYFGWHAIYLSSALVCILLWFLLYFLLPKRIPVTELSYQKLIRSLWSLFIHTPVVRRRALYQASLFGVFSLFWSSAPLWLIDKYHYSQQDIALFAFVGVAGAVAAPIAGRWADKGHSKILTTFALLAAPIAYLSTVIVPQGSIAGLIVLYLCAIVLDMAVSTNLVVGQRAIYSLSASLRGRVNSIFMSVFFIGGAVGSAVSGWLLTSFSWQGIAVIGMLIPLFAFLYFLTEKKSQPSYGEGRDL
nr:MFS transporter [Bacilli bacterium]